MHAILGGPVSRPLGFDPGSGLLYVAGGRLQDYDMNVERVVGTREFPPDSFFLPSAALLGEPES